MTDKSLGDTCDISIDNIAAMLALIGKEEQTTTSPTAIVMLSKLKTNLKILFDKLVARDLKFVLVRMGNKIELDDNWYEYALIKKSEGVTKIRALAEVMNSLQQSFVHKHLSVISSDEGPYGYEFLIEVRDF